MPSCYFSLACESHDEERRIGCTGPTSFPLAKMFVTLGDFVGYAGFLCVGSPHAKTRFQVHLAPVLALKSPLSDAAHRVAGFLRQNSLRRQSLTNWRDQVLFRDPFDRIPLFDSTRPLKP